MRLASAMLLASTALAFAQGGPPRRIANSDVTGALGYVPAATTTARPVDKNVFLGGTPADFCTEAADASLIAPLLQVGTVGLYEHANGLGNCTPSQRSAIWASWASTGVLSGAGQALGEVGGSSSFVPVPPSYLTNFGGSYPVEVDMNVGPNGLPGSGSYTAQSGDAKPGTVYTGYTQVSDLTADEAAVAAAVAVGAKNVAPFISPNGGGEDLDDPFATAPYWANVRALALYSGAIALDVPPTYAFVRGPNYLSMIVQMISWAEAQGLGVTLSVSPYALAADAAGHTGPQGYDPTLYENTQKLVSYLRQSGVMPTKWVSQTYDGGAPYTGNGLKSSAGAAGGMPYSESLTNVALYLGYATVTAAPGVTVPGVPGGAPDSGLQASATTVSSLTVSLSKARVGGLRAVDMPWLGDLASQNSWDVLITGGTAALSFLNTVNLQATGAVNLEGAALSVPSLPTVMTGGQVWLDGTIMRIGSSGARSGLVATANLDVLGQATIHAGSVLAFDPGTLPTADPHVAGRVWSNSGVMTISAG